MSRDGMSRGEAVAMVLMIIVVIATFLGVIVYGAVQDRRELDRKWEQGFFAGACWDRGGKVSGDLCVDGDTVVMRRSDINFE